MVKCKKFKQKRGSFRFWMVIAVFFVCAVCVGFVACARRNTCACPDTCACHYTYVPRDDLTHSDACTCSCVNKNEHYAVSVEDRLKGGFLAFSETVDLKDCKVSAKELCKTFSKLKISEPYLFFLSDELSYTYGEDGSILSVKPKYTMSCESAEEARKYCIKRISEICALAEDLDGDTEKCLFVYDYFCENFKYDHNYENDNIYELFLSGEGTCRAFSLAFSAVLDKLGIETSCAMSEEMGHIWNLVKIDGKWYHCDVSWGACLFTSGGQEHRLHFLCSDKTATEYGHRNFITFDDISCTSRLYDALFSR